LTICEPPTPPVCTGLLVNPLSVNFEASDGGFTTSGSPAAPWQWGSPTSAPIASCSSGTKCWKTNLTSHVNPNANQDLLSPVLNLSGLTGPITVSWAQKYQMQNVTNDTFTAEVHEVGPTNTTTLFQFIDPTMIDSVGNPPMTLNESAGWGLVTR